MLNNITTFFAVTSIATIGLYISYGLPILFKLVLARNNHWKPGPFNLGRFSTTVNIIAVVWICFITVLFCLPSVYPIDQNTLNYAPVAVGVVLFGNLLAWFFPGRWGAHRWFKGPNPETGFAQLEGAIAKGGLDDKSDMGFEDAALGKDVGITELTKDVTAV